MSEELANLPILEELGAQLVAGFRRRETGRLRRPLVRFAALAVAAAVGAGAVLVSELGGGGTAHLMGASNKARTVFSVCIWGSMLKGCAVC